MEGEVAAMATGPESSSVGLKSKEHIGGYTHYMVEFADDFRDADTKGGLVAVGIRDHAMEKKTKDGSAGGDIDVELPTTEGGGEVESGSKTKGGGEAKSSTTTAGGRRKRSKMVKYRMDKSLKPFFSMKPITFDPSRHPESFIASIRAYHEWEKSVLEQFETKGYADYEREEEVTDDEEDPISV